jgi:hypothetical protein
MSTSNQQEIIRAKVNLETSRIEWKDLQRHFANGSAIFVSSDLDLVEVAFQISEDNKAQVKQWMDAKQVGAVTDEQALSWYEADAEMWAVVVSPYVLVQETSKPQ